QQPVLALMPGDPGHVAIILPGSPKLSSAWKLKAPNSAAFSLGHVENAYVFYRLLVTRPLRSVVQYRLAVSLSQL
ncbi:hypothetical protein ACC710_37620, partial [Rhizobium ruizarguesonis]